MKRWLIVFGIGCTLVSVWPSLVMAQTQRVIDGLNDTESPRSTLSATERAARRLLTRGRESMEVADYEAALMDFAAAHELVPSHITFTALSEAYERLGRLAEAIEALESAIDTSARSTRRLQQRRLAVLRRRMAESAAARSDEQRRLVEVEMRVEAVRRARAEADALRASGERAEAELARERAEWRERVALEEARAERQARDEAIQALDEEVNRPLYEEWWLWTIVGVVAVSAALTAVLLSIDFTVETDFADNDLGQVIYTLGAF